MRLWPSSNSEPELPRDFREFNPCHEPESGRFATKGQGNCGPGGAGPQKSPGQKSEGGVSRATALLQDPGFDPEAAIDSMGPAFRAQLEKMFAEAPAAQGEMHAGLQAVAKALKGREVPYEQATKVPGVVVSMGTLKGKKRLIEKAVTDYGGDLSQVKDVVRSTVAVDNPDDVRPVLLELRKQFDVVRAKNRFIRPLSTGYRDAMLNVRLSNGVIGEIQVHVKPMLAAKEGPGHQIYMQLRRLQGRSTRSAQQAAQLLVRRSEQLYKAAWAAAVGAAATTGAGMGS